MTASYVPAGLDRGDGQYEAPHQLVEYSPTIFDTSLDDADRDFRPSLENASPPDQQRAKAVAFDVVPLMLAKGNLAEMVRQHIEGLGLTLPRLYRLNRFARNNAIHEPTTGLAAECEAQGTTAGRPPLSWRSCSSPYDRPPTPNSAPLNGAISSHVHQIPSRRAGCCHRLALSLLRTDDADP